MIVSDEEKKTVQEEIGGWIFIFKSPSHRNVYFLLVF